VLWWALAIGADMGGNLTVIAASANVLVANLAARAGHRISFGEFFRYGSVTTLGTMLIATGYLWLRYLI
jgi:Na+/H+ antiporter NhaD/arsenite permease-like protein